ncbi:MAG: hypothetical protein V1903_00905 [Bacteroidota bacterium]
MKTLKNRPLQTIIEKITGVIFISVSNLRDKYYISQVFAGLFDKKYIHLLKILLPEKL